tara:strand:+ start:4369 stop:6195 length:1827 start_codon:yes stop_codon:yes gene_type:complete
MCGIAGILGNGNLSDAESMVSAIIHRGPNGSGFFKEDVKQGVGTITFGHSRLSIIDLLNSNQPIESDHGCTLLFNGEIYNYISLREKLTDYPFRTNGDGESILALHKKYISDFSKRNTEGTHNPALKHVEWVRKLDGMWGFAIWDNRANELILCRDTMGVKPIVRTILNDGTLLFASEVKAFHTHPDFSAMPDINALSVRLAYEYPLDQTTLFSNVTSVGIGTIETWSLDENGRAYLTGVVNYDKPRVKLAKSWNPATQAKVLLESLRNSIEDRLMADVPVGVVLSGGLDSGLIASIANDVAISKSIDRPSAWTVADSEENVDLKAACLVAKHHDLDHKVSIQDEDTMWKGLSKFSWHGEDLDITVIFWQSVFEMMNGHTNVALCGQGADELHAGYSRYRNLNAHSRVIRERLELAEEITISSNDRGLGKAWSEESIYPEHNLKDIPSALEFEQTRGQLSNFQLRLGDRHSMSYGIEARVPFLSSNHRSISNRLPISYRISSHDEKMALRTAAELTRLPMEIVRRPKLPAGTATSPKLVSDIINELTPHVSQWIDDYGVLAKQLRKQPDMAIGLRLFHAVHFTDTSNNLRSGDLLSLLEDVSDWNVTR